MYRIKSSSQFSLQKFIYLHTIAIFISLCASARDKKCGLSCYAAKLYNPNMARYGGAGILLAIIIQIKFSTAQLWKNRCNNWKNAPSIIFPTLGAGNLYVKNVCKKCGWRDSNSQGLCPHAPRACAYTNSATSAGFQHRLDYNIKNAQIQYFPKILQIFFEWV